MSLKLSKGGLFVGPKGVKEVNPKWGLTCGPSAPEKEL